MNKENKMINFGKQPVSNRFLENEEEVAPHYLLELSWNNELGCPYIFQPWPIQEIRPQFDWITCFEPEDHLDELCKIILNLKNHDQDITIAGYSFKDDSTLNRLHKLGYTKQWRIDPITDLSILNPLSNIETFQSVFNKVLANKITQRNGKADILLVRHVVEHAYDLSEFIYSLTLLIKDNGYIIFELPDCEKAFTQGDCTTIWEEHTFYFFESSFKRCMYINNLDVVYTKSWDYPLENCMIAIVKKKDVEIKKINFSKNIEKDFFTYNNFIKIVEKRKISINKKLKNLTALNGKICILGAGHLSIAFISLLEIDKYISFAIDDNENKSGYFLPVGKIPIKKTSFLNIKDTKLCLLGANPQHHIKIKEKLNIFQNNGGIICSIFPNTNDYLEDVIK